MRRPDIVLARSAAAILALAHAILFSVFLATLAGAAAKAQSSCAGHDLVAGLRVTDPARLAAIEAEAAAVENGEATFWRIDRPGTPPSFLLGTMHSPDPRIARIEGKVADALAQSRIVLVENVESLDAGKMLAAMASLRDVAFLPAGKDIESLLAPVDAALAREAAAARALPWEFARRMQPWMLAAALAIPVCDATERRQGGKALDALIAERAVAGGMQPEGLESVAEQFAAIASLPAEFHLRALTEGLKLGELADPLMATTKELYLQGRIGMILPLMRAYSPAAWGGDGAERLQEALIHRRNAVMVERAVPRLESGHVFLAVGAMHLPGSKGLVTLLRERGFTVVPAQR